MRPVGGRLPETDARAGEQFRVFTHRAYSKRPPFKGVAKLKAEIWDRILVGDHVSLPDATGAARNADRLRRRLDIRTTGRGTFREIDGIPRPVRSVEISEGFTEARLSPRRGCERDCRCWRPLLPASPLAFAVAFR